MPNKEDSESRHRMIVEEVVIPEKSNPEPTIQAEAAPEPKEETPEMPIQNTRYTQEIPQEIDKQKSPVFWILIPGIFILGAILGGVFFYQKGVNIAKVEETPAPTASSVPTTVPSPTPAAKVDVSKLDVAVFNGSGIAGEAAKAKDLLTKAGFNVTSTGNAATYDYTKTIIKAKASVDAAVIQKIKDALGGTYLVGDSQTLSASSTTDIQVVVGSSKAE